VLGVDIAADDLETEERQVLLTALSTFIAIIPVAIALGLFLARKITQPVGEPEWTTCPE
jgi:hypothetical protein